MVGCSLGLGTGSGARINQVLDGRPADGVLEPDDVIISFAHQRIDTATDLVRAVQLQRPGTRVEVELERGGAHEAVIVILDDESVNDGGKLTIGVTVSTEVELAGAETLEGTTVPVGPYVRSVQLEGRLYAVDPLTGVWHAFGVEAPEGAWVAFANEVWILDDTADNPSLVGLTTDRTVAIDPDGWELQLPFAHVGNDVIFLADRPPADPGLTAAREAGLVAIGANSGRITWSWIPGPVATDDGQWIPVRVFVSPNETRLKVALTVNDGRALGAAVLGLDGSLITTWDDNGGRFVDLLPFGWFDNTRLIFFDPATSQVVLLPLVGGDPTPLDVLPNTGLEYVWPVGDGIHVMAQTGGQLNLIDQNGGSRPLAVRCDTPTIAGLGA
jgi:hypothetical protein